MVIEFEGGESPVPPALPRRTRSLSIRPLPRRAERKHLEIGAKLALSGLATVFDATQ
jgi:hypothetical protein